MSDHASLDGEIAIVTGGARGIGEAVVEVFVAHGASVVFCDLDADLGQSRRAARSATTPGSCVPTSAPKPTSRPWRRRAPKRSGRPRSW